MRQRTNSPGKRVLSLLLAVLMICSILPMGVIAESDNVCKLGETPQKSLENAVSAAKTFDTITLLADLEVERFNFGSKILTLDLNGYSLTGSVENATKVTVVNSGTAQNTLAATGTYGNDVSAFVAENYAVKPDDNTTVYYEIVCKIGDALYKSLQAAVATNPTDPIVLVQDVDAVDFNNAEVTIDLNGCFLNGESENAVNVTIKNGFTAKQETLAATGTYANDVSAFVADGYDFQRKTATSPEDKKTVITTDTGKYQVRVVTSTEEDRDELTPETQATVDVISGDSVLVEVRVYGPRFVAADVTLTYDDDCFEVVDDTAGWSEKKNTFHFFSAKPGGGYYEANKTDKDGVPYYLLGTFEFEALPVDGGAMKVPFQVKAEIAEESYAKTFVTGAWKDGTAGAATALSKENLINDYANIILRNMTVSVTPNQPLTYKAQLQNLLKKGYTVKDNFDQKTITGTKIQYCVLTAEEANSLQKTNDADQKLYYDIDGEETTDATTDNEPVMIDGEEGAKVQKTDAAGLPVYTDAKTGLETTEATIANTPVLINPPVDRYTDTFPQAEDAGSYVLYYRVTKNGYNPVESHINLSIAPYLLTMTWNITGFEPKNGYDFYDEFKADRDTEPTATYIDIDNEVKNAAVKMTTYASLTPADGTKLCNTGEYVYTAYVLKEVGGEMVEDTNYTIKETTRTIDVLIDGARIKGYSLTSDPKEETTEPFYDAQDHTPAVLKVAEEDPATEEEELTTGPDLKIKYYISDDFGETWKYGAPEDFTGKEYVLDKIPTVKDPGTYMVKTVIENGPSYYPYVSDIVTFTIKEVKYQAETFEWVAGWSVVFVYTNEASVGFTYDGSAMFDVTDLEYKFGSTLNKNGTRGNVSYDYVYGIIVCGAGNTSLVTPTNGKDNIKSINNYNDDGVKDSRYNVNDSHSGITPSVSDLPEKEQKESNIPFYTDVDINDFVAVNDIYNVGGTYFDKVNSVVLSDELMAIVLKADVTGDKLVDTNDTALVKGYIPAQVD